MDAGEPVDTALRVKGIRALVDFNGVPFEYALRLDAALIEGNSSKAVYVQAVKRLMFNMAVNKGMVKMDPERLVYLSDEEMAKGTIVERVQEQERARYTALVNMLYERSAAVSTNQCESIIHCRRCGSANLSFVQVQTRSADEPMTCMFSCNNCNLKWRMN